MVAYLNADQRVAGEARVARRRRQFLGRDSHVAYAFIAPAFFLLAVLVAYPFVLSFWFSLSDARVGSAGQFIGLANFSHLLTSSIFLQTLQNSIVFTTAAIVAKTVLGLVEAANHGFPLGRWIDEMALPSSPSSSAATSATGVHSWPGRRLARSRSLSPTCSFSTTTSPA